MGVAENFIPNYIGLHWDCGGKNIIYGTDLNIWKRISILDRAVSGCHSEGNRTMIRSQGPTDKPVTTPVTKPATFHDRIHTQI